jgi:pSer/pThr/pTyr-binding forkhead associated (FHA) protein
MLRETRPTERAAARVVIAEDAFIVAGSLAIEAIVDDQPAGLMLERTDGTRIAVTDGMTLGRASDNGVVVRDGRASRRHARITADGSSWYVEDTGSSNGTYVDGTKVDRLRLEDGAILTIGDTPLRVVEA